MVVVDQSSEISFKKVLKMFGLRLRLVLFSDLVSPFEHEIQIQIMNIEKLVIALHLDYLK